MLNQQSILDVTKLMTGKDGQLFVSHLTTIFDVYECFDIAIPKRDAGKARISKIGGFFM